MAELNIPTEVKDKAAFPQLKKIDRQVICAAVLMGLPNLDAFKLFHPEFLDRNGKLNDAGKKAGSMFWNYGKNKDYREQYENEVAEFLGMARVDPDESITDNRKDKALKALLNQAMGMVEAGMALDADTLKTVTEIFKKLNILKDDIEQTEAPRRYLPVRCRTECQYRLFCEQAIANGEIDNECRYCKALAIAQEHGYRYDPTTNLNIPDIN